MYLDDRNVFQPDIVYISEERSKIIDWNKGILGAPDLILEILSKGNRDYDLNDKKKVYESAGVKEYWMVDPATKRSEGFSLESGTYKALGIGQAQLFIEMFELPISF